MQLQLLSLTLSQISPSLHFLQYKSVEILWEKGEIARSVAQMVISIPFR